MQSSRCLAALGFGLCVALAAVGPVLSEEAPAGAHENNGQDPTNPVSRFDTRLRYRNSPGDIEGEILTLRADRPIALGHGWKLNTRLDVPVMRTNIPSRDNPNGDYEVGLSDVLVQALAIAPPKGKWTIAFGSQLIMPTASQDELGGGKWQLAPTIAAVRQLPSLSRGSFVGVLVKDQFSFAGDGDRPGKNDLTLEPIFNWNLPNRWFLTFAPEIKWDLKNGGDVFVPFDVTVGRKISKRAVLSLQADIGLIKDYEQYDWQVEARLGVFF